MEKMPKFNLANDSNAVNLLQQLYDEEKYRKESSPMTNEKDGFKMMFESVRKHAVQIRKLGKKIQKECDLYEQKHCKQSTDESMPSIVGSSDNRYDNKSAMNFHLNKKCHLIQSEQFGRHFIANDSILPGEILLKERPILFTFYEDHRKTYCHYCHCSLNVNHNNNSEQQQWPCEKCDEIYYCSSNCRQLGWRQYHSFECGIYGLIAGPGDIFSFGNVYRYYAIFGHQLIDECKQNEYDKVCNDYIHNQRLRSLPLSEWSDKERFQACKLITLFLHHRNEHATLREAFAIFMSWVLIHLFVRKQILQANILDDLVEFSHRAEHLARDLLRMQTNAFCWSSGPIGFDLTNSSSSSSIIRLTTPNMIANCIQSIGSFFNHSCTPNVLWRFSSKGIHLQAKRLIKRGEQLTISYGTDATRQSIDKRQMQLHYNYCFYCQCMACRNECCFMKNVIQCLDDQCSGPLVLNKHNVCISCGQRPSNLYEAYGLMKKINAIRLQFFGLFDSLNNENVQNPISRIVYYIRYRSNRTSYLKPNQTEKKIKRLEQLYEKYRQIAYHGSYRLLYLSIIMVAIYERFRMPYKVFELIDTIDMNLMDIFPKYISKDNIILLIKSLESLCHLFEKLLPQIDFNDRFLPLSKNGAQDSDENGGFILRSKFVCLFERINQLLMTIFDEDISQNGWLFPKTFKRLHPDNDDDDTYRRLRLSEEEEYFKYLHQKCQQRIIHIQKWLNKY